jgi:transcriptional regulator with XRE-family HTH domain
MTMTEPTRGGTWISQRPQIRPERLKHLRIRNRLSQINLATRSGVSRAEISRIENGVIRRPHFDTVERLATSLNVNQDVLLDWDS